MGNKQPIREICAEYVHLDELEDITRKLSELFEKEKSDAVKMGVAGCKRILILDLALKDELDRGIAELKAEIERLKEE